MNFRSVNESDLPILTRFVEMDLFHDNRYPVSFWNGSDTFAAEDEAGVVCYLRPINDTPTRVRMYIQFPPLGEVSKKRVALAVLAITDMAVDIGTRSGCTEIVFGSVSNKLISFLVKYGGFVHESGNDYVRYLERN